MGLGMQGGGGWVVGGVIESMLLRDLKVVKRPSIRRHTRLQGIISMPWLT